MSTATSNTTLERIAELQAEATELRQQANDIETQYSAKMREIASLASGECDGDDPPSPPPRQTTAAAAVATATTPRPPKRGPGRPGRKPAAALAAPKANGPVAPEQRNYSNSMSLKEATFNVLNREPDEWREIIPELPAQAYGLTAGEIKKIIDHEKQWVSASNDISSQLQGALRDLRNRELIERGDDRRYYVPEGVSYKD